MIIGVFGFAGSGKDTVGKMIQYLTSTTKFPVDMDLSTRLSYFGKYQNTRDATSWEIKQYATPLKQIASILSGIPVEKFEDQEFKKSFMSEEWDQPIPDMKITKARMTVREFLQKIGTEAMKHNVHWDVWKNCLMKDYKLISRSQVIFSSKREQEGQVFEEYPNWIITDNRYPDELQRIEKAGGISIRISRKGVGPINNHPTETALIDYPANYEIDNFGILEDMLPQVEAILKIEKIIT